MRAADAPLLFVLKTEFYRQKGILLDDKCTLQSISELLADPEHGRIGLIIVKGVPIGYVVLSIEEEVCSSERGAMIDEVYVRPALSPPDLGAKIMQWVTQFCRHVGIRVFHGRIGRSYLMTRWLK